MLKNRVFYVLLLLAMVMIYIFTNTYYTLMLLVLSILIPVISLVLMLFSRRGLDISLEVPKTAEKKDAEIKYIFSNTSKFPAARVAFRIKLENQMTGAVKIRKASVFVGGRKTVAARLALENSKVGTVLISTERIRVYDAFGLFAFRKPSLQDQAMIVYPDMYEIAVHMQQAVETSGDGSRYSAERPGQDVSQIFALRDYIAGDEIRKIHWKLSSKLDKTVIRDFSLPLNYSVFLLLELKQGSEDMVDAQVEIYLALSRALLESGINHSIGWFDAGTEEFYVKELDNIEDFEMAAAQVLSSYASERKGSALEYYITGGYRSHNNILLYVVTDPDLDNIAELEVSQRMQTILIYEDEAAADAAKQAVQAITLSVDDAASGLPEIIV